MKYLEEQLRQILGMTVWSHKIHEKQASMYMEKKRKLELINIILITAAIIGVLMVMFFKEYNINYVVIVVMIINALISIYLKSYDFKGLNQSHRNCAIELFSIKEDIVSTLCDIKANNIDKEELSKKRRDISARYQAVCKKSLDPKNKAFKKAEQALVRSNGVYSNDQINNLLPNLLKVEEEIEVLEDIN